MGRSQPLLRPLRGLLAGIPGGPDFRFWRQEADYLRALRKGSRNSPHSGFGSGLNVGQAESSACGMGEDSAIPARACR